MSVAAKPFFSPLEFLSETHGYVGKNFLYSLLYNGHLKSARIGRKLLVPRSEPTDLPAREAARQKPHTLAGLDF